MSINLFRPSVREAALGSLKAAGGVLNAPTLILLKAVAEKSLGLLVMADLTEADFAGYAAQAGIAFGVPFTVQGDLTMMTAPPVQFTNTGNVAQDIVGWALVNVGKTAFHYLHLFRDSEHRSVGYAGESIVIVPTVRYGE